MLPGPKLLNCDEPVSSLGGSVQARVINLLDRLREELGLTMLFISHDLGVVKNVCDRIAVMHLGKICEQAPSEKLYRHFRHPYTRALVRAIPKPVPHRPKQALKIGEMPSPVNPPSGCRFHPRCYRARDLCRRKEPELIQIEPKHTVACHFPDI